MNTTKTGKRITLIGPVYPYKGGISHYTSLLCRALQQIYDVQLLSFSMQYPKLLYHHEQKDYTDDALRIGDAQYVINTANPLTWPKTAGKIAAFDPDLVILEWWHPYFAPCWCGILNRLKDIYRQKARRNEAAGQGQSARCSTPQILFLCHNVFPHERFPMDWKLTRQTLTKGGLYIVQSARDAADLKTIIPNARYRQTVHPTYDVFHFGQYTRESSRETLHLAKDQKVLLFFGFVREYKGLRYLLEAMPEILKTSPDTTLVVAGDFSSEESRKEYLNEIDQLGIADHVLIQNGYIPDKEIEKYFLAADLAVCPYTDATQSGIVQIAYGFDLPVVATRVGGLPDVIEDGKTGYLVEKENPHQLAEAIHRYFAAETSGTADAMRENIRREADRFSWEHLVDVIGELAGF